MTVAYIETYLINGTRYGIEDYEDGRPDSEHFFPDHEHRQYRLWCGGCGIGHRGTLVGARLGIFNHALSRADTAQEEAINRLTNAREVVMALRGPGVPGLQEFRVEEEEKSNA